MSPRLALALAVPLLLAGCGGGSEQAATVSIEAFKYEPATVHVQVGGQVTFVNQDNAGHTATFTAGPSKLDTDRLVRGGRAKLHVGVAAGPLGKGAFHAFMKGAVVVDD